MSRISCSIFFTTCDLLVFNSSTISFTCSTSRLKYFKAELFVIASILLTPDDTPVSDIILKTEVSEDHKVLIDKQYIGSLKGLKFIIDFTSKNLDADLKSIKKAARKGVEKELIKRVNTIIKEKNFLLTKELITL